MSCRTSPKAPFRGVPPATPTITLANQCDLGITLKMLSRRKPLYFRVWRDETGVTAANQRTATKWCFRSVLCTIMPIHQLRIDVSAACTRQTERNSNVCTTIEGIGQVVTANDYRSFHNECLHFTIYLPNASRLQLAC